MPRPGRGDRGVYETTVSVLSCLPEYVRQKRERNGLSLREAAEQAGISHTLLHRIEHGGQATTETLQAVLRWLAA